MTEPWTFVSKKDSVSTGSGIAHVLDRPVWADKSNKIGKFWDRETQVALWADFPLVREICTILSDDREARSVADVEPSGAYNGIHLALDSVFAYDAVLRDLIDGREVDVYIRFLDGEHIRITWCDSSTTDTPRRSEAIQETLVLDKLSHPSFQKLLAFRLRCRVLVERSPEAIDLVLDALGVLDEFCGVFVEDCFLLFGVLVVRPVVVGNFHEPYWGPDEYVEMFGMRLHRRHSLNGRCSRANHGDLIVLPLFGLVVFGPPGCVDDLLMSAKSI